jgi:lipopolysaccharide/colanic/teichoic acid biosynthesis glycosyltransferase
LKVPEPLTMVGLAAGVGTIGIHLARRFFGVAKEISDVVFGFVALVLSLPLFVVCAATVKLSGKGPVFFLQPRVGCGGREFMMIKFRTMFTNRTAGRDAVWTEDNDSRIVPACRWMRRTHVDELPQLINVIKGEMSLVGPRPERPEIVSELEKVCPEFTKRHMVRPGITGLAQIKNGYASSVDDAIRKLRLDLEYIEQQRWSTELRILAGTVPKLFGDDKAH